jgi:alpha-L-glutamate ligase-like protein
VLGINARNLLYVHGLNPRRHFPLADDKIRTKRLLSAAGVPVPETLAVLTNLAQVGSARPLLEAAAEFAIKPARGRQGSGILVITTVEGGRFVRAGGESYSWDDLRRAMGDILFGVYSFGRHDRVMVERRIKGHEMIGALSELGLPDVRVILLRGEPVMAMMRVPTVASGGRANLHQGALGIAVRLRDGLAFRCVLKGSPVTAHPDTGAPVTGVRLPYWDEVIDVARRAAAAVPLPYLGVDIILAHGSGPIIMEVNVRPGLEIQNVNGRGLRRGLERAWEMPGSRP